MIGELKFTGLSLGIKTARCSNHCRYCLAGHKKYDTISFTRFEALMDRFIAWKAETQSVDFNLSFTFFYSFEFGLQRQIRQWKLGDRLGLRGRTLLMNGLMIRPEDEMRDWLLERQQAGANRIHSAFYGTRELQDKTHGRRGDHDFLMRANRTAAELGLPRQERLFLTQETLPLLPELLDELDEIPNLEKRWIQTLAYCGWARQMESLRCTRTDLAALPPQVMQYLDCDNLVTESEFIAQVQSGYPLTATKELSIWVEDSNIEELESKSCEEMVAEEKQKRSRLYSLLPELGQLSQSYGEATAQGLYGAGSVIAMWRERYLNDHRGLVAPSEVEDFVHF